MIEQRLDGSEKRSLPSKQTNKQTNNNKYKKKFAMRLHIEGLRVEEYCPIPTYKMSVMHQDDY